jgi:hypothetical protein
MPQGIPYGKDVMPHGRKSMSQLMGIESKEHGKKMSNMKGVMEAETKEYGKRPASKAALMKGESKEHGKKMMPPWMKGK